jgi:hypothetical protein
MNPTDAVPEGPYNSRNHGQTPRAACVRCCRPPTPGPRWTSNRRPQRVAKLRYPLRGMPCGHGEDVRGHQAGQQEHAAIPLFRVRSPGRSGVLKRGRASNNALNDCSDLSWSIQILSIRRQAQSWLTGCFSRALDRDDRLFEVGAFQLHRCGAVLEVPTKGAAVGRHTLSVLVTDRVDRRQADSADGTRHVRVWTRLITVSRAPAPTMRESSVPNTRQSPFDPRPLALHARPRIMTRIDRRSCLKCADEPWLFEGSH